MESQGLSFHYLNGYAIDLIGSQGGGSPIYLFHLVWRDQLAAFWVVQADE